METLSCPLEQVEAAARTDGRHVLLFFSAPWSGPSGLMERAIAEPEVAAAAAAVANLLRVDAEAHPALMQRFALRSVPGVVLLRPDSSAQVIVGPLSAAQLRDWLVGVKAGHSADVAPDWNVKARRNALEAHVSSGHADRVLPELDWFWADQAGGLYGMDRFLPEFVSLLARAIRTAPAVRAHFTKARDAFVPGDGPAQPGLADWLALNDALGETHATLDWFDARVAHGAVPVPALARVRRALLERGRAGDLLHVMRPPLDDVKDAFERLAAREDQREHPFPPELTEMLRDDVRVEAALALRACEAGRPEEAAAVRAAILGYDDSERVRHLLALPLDELKRLDSVWSFTVE